MSRETKPSDATLVDAGKPTAAGRLLAILDVFRTSNRSLTLSEICERSNLSMTTTHRLVHELRSWGALEKDPWSSGIKYQLSTKVLDLASSTAAMKLRDRAAPYLSALHRYTGGSSVHLGIRESRTVMYVESLRGHAEHSGANRVGGRLPLHVSAAGLVLLAYSEPHVVRDYLSDPLRPFTEHTVTNSNELERYLHRIRADGYAVARELLTSGEAAVAAPVLDAKRQVQSAVGLIVELPRHDPDSLVRPVQLTARRISAAMLKDDFRPDPRILDFQ